MKNTSPEAEGRWKRPKSNWMGGPGEVAAACTVAMPSMACFTPPLPFTDQETDVHSPTPHRMAPAKGNNFLDLITVKTVQLSVPSTNDKIRIQVIPASPTNPALDRQPQLTGTSPPAPAPEPHIPPEPVHIHCLHPARTLVRKKEMSTAGPETNYLSQN